MVGTTSFEKTLLNHDDDVVQNGPGRCWCCWESGYTTQNRLIRACRGCKDQDLQWVHQSCIDAFVNSQGSDDESAWPSDLLDVDKIHALRMTYGPKNRVRTQQQWLQQQLINDRVYPHFMVRWTRMPRFLDFLNRFSWNINSNNNSVDNNIQNNNLVILVSLHTSLATSMAANTMQTTQPTTTTLSSKPTKNKLQCTRCTDAYTLQPIRIPVSVILKKSPKVRRRLWQLGLFLAISTFFLFALSWMLYLLEVRISRQLSLAEGQAATVFQRHMPPVVTTSDLVAETIVSSTSSKSENGQYVTTQEVEQAKYVHKRFQYGPQTSSPTPLPTFIAGEASSSSKLIPLPRPIAVSPVYLVLVIEVPHVLVWEIRVLYLLMAMWVSCLAAACVACRLWVLKAGGFLVMSVVDVSMA